MVKKRFGVSIPFELYKQIDQLCSKIGCTRSSIVEEAIEKHLRNAQHYFTKHICLGIMVTVRNECGKKYVKEIGRYGKLIRNYTHIHYDKYCIEVYLLLGNSDEIIDLHRTLEKSNIYMEVKYIPLIEEMDSKQIKDL